MNLIIALQELKRERCKAMSNDYDKFLCRMVEYREKLHLTQKDVGNFLGKDQSQFSKMELGKTVVSYERLESLRGTGCDID